MNPISLSRSITDFVYSLLKTETAMDVCSHIARTSGSSSLISWDSQPREERFPHDHFGTLVEYCYFLNNKQYSAVLSDGSLLQMSYRIKKRKVVWHRLSYHPCPVALDARELEGVALADFIENMDAGSLKARVRARSAIRFDYDPVEARADHPASHVTLNEAFCRIPVKSSLSPRSFVGFVFSNFYPRLWGSIPALHALPDDALAPCITADDMNKLHLHRVK